MSENIKSTITSVSRLPDEIRKKPNANKFTKYDALEKLIHHIGEMILKARKEAGLTESELAKKAGITSSVISRIESGDGAWVPSLDTLVRIASALNTKLLLKLEINDK